MDCALKAGMKQILSLIALAGMALAQGCLFKSDDAAAKTTDLKPAALALELDNARAQTQTLTAKVKALDQALAAAQRDLDGEKLRAAGVQAENEKLQSETMRLTKIVSRLDPTKAKTLWTRAELERALIGQTREEVQRVLGAPSASYGSAAPFVKYARVCVNPANGRVDESVQFNFEAGVLKSVVY